MSLEQNENYRMNYKDQLVEISLNNNLKQIIFYIKDILHIMYSPRSIMDSALAF